MHLTAFVKDCNALSAGFFLAHHGLHIGCQCESESLSYALSPWYFFQLGRAMLTSHSIPSLTLHLLCLFFSSSFHLCFLDVNQLPFLFVKLNFPSWIICLWLFLLSFLYTFALSPCHHCLTLREYSSIQNSFEKQYTSLPARFSIFN